MKVHKSCTVCTFGYCAPNRCYCGHEECKAFASWEPIRIEVAPIVRVKPSHYEQAWANREVETWIDKL